MSDSEDDYMLFNVDSKEDVRPSLLFNRDKRKMDIFKEQQYPSKKRQKSLRELEQENRDKGLKTVISKENKGFQLLEKMGFKQGDSLGKSRNGIKEPIDIRCKQGTSGIGTETHLKDLVSKRNELKMKNSQLCEDRFKFAKKEKQSLVLLRRDFFKAQKICEELDFRDNIENPIEDFFWTKATVLKNRKLQNSDTDELDCSEMDNEFEMHVTQENLFAIINYLRSKHLYCLYCVITGTDMEDLEKNCPGSYRMDHDDEL